MMQKTDSIYTKLARFFVTNTQMSLLLVIVTFTFGFLSFYQTPKQYDPEITLPAFRITTHFPGASAREVEMRVTNEIEHALIEIPDVDDMMSESYEGGKSIVIVTFAIGTDPEESLIQVQERVTRFASHTPLGIHVPTIERIDPENVPVMTLALTSDTYDIHQLREVGFAIRESLMQVPSVSHIEVIGGAPKEILVTPHPIRMAHRQVDIPLIQNALAQYSTRAYIGTIVGSSSRIMVQTTPLISDLRTLETLRVGGTPASPVLLRDVASITEGYDVNEQRVEIAEKKDGITSHSPAVYISLAKTKGSNISSVTEAVREALPEIEHRVVPEEVHVSITRDEGETAREEILTLTEHLFFAVAIVTLILYFFLGMRIALIVATAIPLTLALVFIVGYLFDQSINRITLFALIFSLGLLVDDAIVVIENIHRHLNKRVHDTKEAIARATGEVGSGVFLSTITAVVVFAPMGIVTGMMGAYMGPIAFFAPVARLASLGVAYTLSPYLASKFLNTKQTEDAEHAHAEPAYIQWYVRVIEKILNNERTQKRIIWGASLFVVGAFLLPAVGIVHFRMLPKADKQQFAVYVDAPMHATDADVYARVRDIDTALLTLPEVHAVEVFVGTPPVIDFNGLFRGTHARTESFQATLKVTLTHSGERSRTSEEVVTDARALLTDTLKQYPEIRVKLVEDPPGPPVLSTMVVRVKGAEHETRERIIADVSAQMQAITGIVDIDTTAITASHQAALRIDREKAERLGVSVAAVERMLYLGIEGSDVSLQHTTAPESRTVNLRLKTDDRGSLERVLSLTVQSTRGTAVPLRAFTTTAVIDAPEVILRDARAPMSMITAETEGRSVVYTTIELMRNLWSYTLPDGQGERTGWDLFGMDFVDTTTGEPYRIEWGGEFEMTLENFRDLGLAMLVSYLLIYMILVAQFRAFLSPALIMTTIILGFAGVLPGFALLDALFGIYFSATSMIGAIALGGIVVGNAILLLDFIETARASGVAKKDAVLGACKTRLQPILLTSVTAVLGAIVIVADPVWSGLAWALVFGLSLSTVLTLVIFPVLYMRFVR